MLGREHFQNVHPDHYSFLLNFAITLLLVSVSKLVKHLVKNVFRREMDLKTVTLKNKTLF